MLKSFLDLFFDFFSALWCLFLASGAKPSRTRIRQNDFVFFPVRDIPLRFNSLNLIFSAPPGRIHPILV